MKALPSILFIIVLIFVPACTDNSYISEKEASQSNKLSDDNVFKGYESALDKAKGVEQTIMDAADVRKRDMEEQGY